MLNIIGEGITKGAKKALRKATKEAGEEVTEKALTKVGKEAVDNIASGSVLGKIIAKNPDDMAGSALNNLLPTVRTNWAGKGDIESMLDGKFLSTNSNYFPSTFSEGALGRATYGADQPIDQKKVAGLVRAIKNNEDLAPIAGFRNDEGLIDIFDGHHRLAAFQKAGKMPRVKLFDRASKADAYNYADEWAKNAIKDAQQYLPAKTLREMPGVMQSKVPSDEKMAKLIEKAKNYKTPERFYKMNNPIKGSEIWGEKPAGIFQRDSRAVRVNMFPNDTVKGTGMTKQYLLNMFKDAYDQGITNIVPSYGIFTKEGASFMDHLAEQGWLDAATNGSGYKSYSIAPKIQEWGKTTPLEDIFQQAHTLESKGPSLVDMARNIKAMRASRNMSEDGIRRIGSANVAPVNPDTLPSGWKELEGYLDNAAERLPRELGIPKSKITKGDLASYLDEVGYDSAGTKDEMWKNALMAIDDNALDEIYNAGGGTAADFLQNRLPFRHNSRLTDATNYYIGNKGRTGSLDAEYSDRLGIGRSNTPMSDNLVNPYSSAGGDYSEGAFGTSPTWATGETGVSTAAHERMHAWQDINKFDWDEGVVDAIDELRSELKKFYHDNDTLKKYHGGGKLEYYADPKEQEARMLQSYLDNEGFTNTYKRTSEKGTEWGNEIKPAFDRFFDKLRALSKAGVALPAALLALLAVNGDNKKEEN